MAACYNLFNTLGLQLLQSECAVIHMYFQPSPPELWAKEEIYLHPVAKLSSTLLALLVHMTERSVNSDSSTDDSK